MLHSPDPVPLLAIVGLELRLPLDGDSKTKRTRPRESGEECYEERKQIEGVQNQVTLKSLLPTLVTPWAHRL